MLASPFIAGALQRRTLLGPRGSEVALDGAMVLPVATLSLGAGLIHMAVIPDHFGEDALSGLFFVVAAAFQLAWALAWARRPQRGVAVAGLGVNAAIVAIWLLSRTVGLPLGAEPGVPEPLAAPDFLATIFELGIVCATLGCIVSPLRRALQRASFPVASADLALVMALVVISMVTSYAMAEISTGGGHADANAEVTSPGP